MSHVAADLRTRALELMRRVLRDEQIAKRKRLQS